MVISVWSAYYELYRFKISTTRQKSFNNLHCRYDKNKKRVLKAGTYYTTGTATTYAHIYAGCPNDAAR